MNERRRSDNGVRPGPLADITVGHNGFPATVALVVRRRDFGITQTRAIQAATADAKRL